MPHFASSDLVLHCLPMSHKRDARIISVKYVFFWVLLCVPHLLNNTVKPA